MTEEREDAQKPALELLITIPERITTAHSTAAMRDVIRERFRQITEEGRTTEKDDLYQSHELEAAAYCYAAHAAMTDDERAAVSGPPVEWPFALEWWRPSTRESDLIKSASLSIAALEAIYRKATRQEHEG